jgi:hypothetical protein
MVEPGPPPPRFAQRLRISGLLIVLGLLIETATLYSGHPLAFVAYLVFGGSLVAAGLLVYLWAVVFKSL